MPYWLLIIIGISLSAGIGLSIYYKNGAYMAISAAIFIALVLLSGFPIMTMTADNPHYSTKYVENTPIYSLRTTEMINGSFILGSGNVNENSFYIYYTQSEDGSYSINKVEATKCKIFMDRDNNAIFAKVWGKCNDENLIKHWGWPEVIFSHYEFHLPYGSLVQNYSVR